MKHARTLAIVLIVALAAGFLVAAGTSSAHAEASANGAMSWWGYWAGKKGDSKPGIKYIKQKKAATFGTNIVLVHAQADNGNLPVLKDTLVRAKAQNVGVILMIDRLLRKPDVPGNGCGWFCDPDGVYTAADYEQWNARMQALKNGIGEAVNAIVVIAGFDEVNLFGSWMFQAEPGLPKPIAYSMQLAAQYFPTVPNRGHVWKIGPAESDGVLTPPNADTLEGSTLPLAYYYSTFTGPFNATTVPYCPHEGTLPGAQLPEGSKLVQDRDVLKLFVDRVNAVRGTATTPILYIPYSNIGSNVAGAVASRAIGCHLEAWWTWMHCKSLRNPNSWAGQMRGFLAWQWDKEPNYIDPVTGKVVKGWTGTQSNPYLKTSGRWIGANRNTVPCPNSM
jgi:hypothetical protein